MIRAGLASAAKGIEEEVERHIWAAAWSVCDSCQTATLTAQGSIVLLSRSLFTREKNDSPYGDLLKLDIGQLGSRDWSLWAGLGEPDPDGDHLSEEDLERLLYPFYGHHVLIREKDFEAELATQKTRIVATQATPNSPKLRGRPQKILTALEVYKSLYPNGHEGHRVAEVIRAIAKNGGPELSRRSFDRMFEGPASSQKG